MHLSTKTGHKNSQNSHGNLNVRQPYRSVRQLLKTVVVKRFCNMNVQSTYVEYLVSNGVRYPL